MKVDKDTCLFNLLTRVERERGMKVDKDTCLFNLLTRVEREGMEENGEGRNEGR